VDQAVLKPVTVKNLAAGPRHPYAVPRTLCQRVSAPQLHRRIVAFFRICASGGRDQETSRMDLPALRTRFRGGRCPGRHRGRNALAAILESGRGNLAGDFGQLQPLRSHLSEDRARFEIGRNLRQLQAMGGEGDVLLSFVD
jgi:hypothetical protein